MTEWQLQKELTVAWAGRGGMSLAGEWFSLLAWEVMLPSWRINDARGHWSEPSIDFLALDRDGHLVAVELKVGLRGITSVMETAMQVTATAVMLARTGTEERIRSALNDLGTGSGDRGTRPPYLIGRDLWSTHQQLHGLDRPCSRLTAGVGRVVAVRDPGPRVAQRIEQYPDPRDESAFAAAVGDPRATRLRRRLAGVMPIQSRELTGAIQFAQV
jgi:hypothetical protein